MTPIASRKTLILILFLLTSSPLFAASGKITGQVTDKSTRTPLPGVNILLEGSTMGAISDLEGHYVIMNVPPGTYTLRASYVGYATTRVENVRASIDQTTRQDFALSQVTIAGEEVMIVAERPLVQKDLTASQKTTTAEEISAMPVESFVDVLKTQAGVNTGADGALHIRGGRSTEVAYLIDGVPVTNPFFTNSLATSVSNKSLEEMKVVSGAFNAEYGNAMSGIVNIRLKEGSDRYSGSFSASSGDFISSHKEIFYNIDDINPAAAHILEGSLSGPVPLAGKRVTFNSSARYDDSEGYLYGVREHLPSDSADFRYADNWYIELGGDSAYVPMAPNSALNLMNKLTWKISPAMKLSGQMLYDRNRSKSYSHDYRYNPEGTLDYLSDNYNYSLKFSHVFTKSFYEANVYTSSTDYKSYKFKDPYDSRYVPTTTVRGEPSSATFNFGGMQMGHNYRKSQSLGGKLDFTSQIHTRHEVKAGASFRFDNLQERIYTVLYDNQEYREPTVKPENESPSHIYYDKDADYYSSYIQDKIEYDDFIVNAGLRFDYFDPKNDYVADLIHPDSGERTKAEAKKMFSPRLGVSFPITDNGILHFSYGHFFQMPPLRRLYLENIFGAGTSPEIGYSNLKPEKTVIYEFGLQQQLTTYLAFDVNVFAKDIRDLMALQQIRYESSQFGPSSYYVYLNKDYGAVKGVTASLTKRRDPVTKISAWVDYTYQVTDGNSVNSGAFFFSALSGIEEEKRIVPLNWDQRHVLNATVTLSEPGNWGVSFIGNVSSGWPYTPEIPNANYIPNPNSERKPWQRSVDMNLFKNIKFQKVGLVFFVKVYNLFDTLNERYVFDDTGRAGYTFWNRSSQESAELIRHYGEQGIHTWSEYQVRPTYYQAPRLVQAGLSLEF